MNHLKGKILQQLMQESGVITKHDLAVLEEIVGLLDPIPEREERAIRKASIGSGILSGILTAPASIALGSPVPSIGAAIASTTSNYGYNRMNRRMADSVINSVIIPTALTAGVAALGTSGYNYLSGEQSFDPAISAGVSAAVTGALNSAAYMNRLNNARNKQKPAVATIKS